MPLPPKHSAGHNDWKLHTHAFLATKSIPESKGDHYQGEVYCPAILSTYYTTPVRAAELQVNYQIENKVYKS